MRLSADPAQLLYMNQKYEEEFNRMLELEQRWQGITNGSKITHSC